MMVGKISVVLLIILLVLQIPNLNYVFANKKDTPLSFEEIYTQIGYKSVEEAVADFENHFKADVKLPIKLPPLPFTHQVGRFNEDKQFNLNDSLEIEYISDISPENHYKITVRPLKNKIKFKNRGNQTVFTLEKGQKAIYRVEQHANLFIFECYGWQYMIGFNKKIANTMTPGLLVEIANSIGYVPKEKSRLYD